VLEHVQARARQVAALQRRDERGLVHQRAARAVDQHRAGAHGGQRVRIDDVARRCVT
jgi:hypothetical protein